MLSTGDLHSHFRAHQLPVAQFSLLTAGCVIYAGEAFTSLIAEKLAPDERFRIFTDLLERVRADLPSAIELTQQSAD